MDKESLDEVLESLRKVRRYCDFHLCDKNCLFNSRYGCTFFDKPFEWELSRVEDNYEENEYNKGISI